MRRVTIDTNCPCMAAITPPETSARLVAVTLRNMEENLTKIPVELGFFLF